MVTYYTVGGFVRDEILGVKSKDIDFAVEANSYEEMKEDILQKGMVIFQERPEYFAIRARHPTLGGADFTLCRKDGFYSDNRRPDSVEIGTIYDDLARRDFTINAIAKTEDGEYIDPHQGIIDINRRLLRCVGDTEDRFSEDPLRMLRAIRFHIVRGFNLTQEIDYLLRHSKFIRLLDTVPVERKYEELKKCFEYDTLETLEFLSDRPYLQIHLFENARLGLEPVIYAPVAQSAEATVSKAV